jgi:hypothetical protein
VRPCSWLSMKNGALGGALLVHASDVDGASSAGDLVSHKVVRCTGAPRTLIAPWQPACTSQTACICRCHFASAAWCLRGLDARRRVHQHRLLAADSVPPDEHTARLEWVPQRAVLSRWHPHACHAKGTAAYLLTNWHRVRRMRVRPRRYVLLRGPNAPWPSMTTVDGIFAAGQGVCSEPTRLRAFAPAASPDACCFQALIFDKRTKALCHSWRSMRFHWV